MAERPAELPRPRRHRLRLVQPSSASSRATSSASTTSSPRSRTSCAGLGADVRRLDPPIQARRLPRRHRAPRQLGVLPAVGAEDHGGGARAPGWPTSRCSARSSSTTRPTSRRSSATAASRTCSTSRSRTQLRTSRRARRPRARSRTGSRTTTTSGRRTASSRRRRRSSATTTWAARRSRSRSRRGTSPARSSSQRVLLGYDLLYLLRGAPTVYYGDEVGMIGTGGDKAARQDMFPTKVRRLADARSASAAPPIGTGSSFDVDDHPIEQRLGELARAARRAPRALDAARRSSGCADGQVLVVSRIDGRDAARVRRRVQLGDGCAARHGADGVTGAVDRSPRHGRFRHCAEADDRRSRVGNRPASLRFRDCRRGAGGAQGDSRERRADGAPGAPRDRLGQRACHRLVRDAARRPRVDADGSRRRAAVPRLRRPPRVPQGRADRSGRDRPLARRQDSPFRR